MATAVEYEPDEFIGLIVRTQLGGAAINSLASYWLPGYCGCIPWAEGNKAAAVQISRQPMVSAFGAEHLERGCFVAVIIL